MVARRKLLFRGGQSAIDFAQSIAERGGVSSGDAMAGVAAGLDVNGSTDDQMAITEAAYKIARTGDMGMAEAVQAITRNPGARMAAVSGNSFGAAALVLGGNNPMGRSRAMERLLSASEQRSFAPLDDLQGVGNTIDAIQGNDYNGANVAAREALAGVRNPEATATFKLLQVQLEALDLQRRQVDGMSRLAVFMDKYTGGNKASLDYQAAVGGFAEASASYRGGGR